VGELISSDGGVGSRGGGLCLDLTREADSLKASLCPVGEGARTLSGYERYTVDWRELEARCASLAAGLNLLAAQGGEQRQGLAGLERVGGALFDALLSPRLKEALVAAPSAPLLLSIDDGLVHIPWELLFDGERFLCLRHAMGRVVRTEQAVSARPHRDLSRPLRALIVADPEGNLPSAYREGRALRDALAAHPGEIDAALKTTSVTLRQLRDRLRDADLVHFAGHATYVQENPGESGWVVSDGTLSSREIRTLAGGARPMPSLIFSNACQSGQTSAWRADDRFQEDIFGVANAFLLAGVRHYVGTFFDIPDETSATLATAFYDRLLAGAPVGEAMLAARKTCIDRYGRHHAIWASYMLYGDPTFTYRPTASPAITAVVTNHASVTDLARARAQLDARLAARSEVLCVMFADLVGSTRYFEGHGDIAGRAWVQRFRDRFAAQVEGGGGRTIKGVGDGMLATFRRSEDALDVARRLLEAQDRVDADVSQHTQIRVALHRGSVVVEDDDVMGDTVNVVCRLIGHAAAGEALVSREAAVSLATPAPDLDDVGVRQLKGREEPVHIYRLHVGDGVVAGVREPVATRSAIAATPADLAPEVPVLNRWLVFAVIAALGVFFLVVGMQRGILPFPRTEADLPAGPHAGPMVQTLSPAAAEARDRLVVEGIDRERSGDLDGAAAAYRRALDVNPGDPYLQAFAERLDRRMAAAAQGEQQRHTDELITRIADWKRRQPADAEVAADTWTSRPITLAFLGFTETGESRERVGTAEYLALLLQDGFSQASRVEVVERELLAALLRELNLSTTELIDRTASLPIGRLLAARVLAAGRLFYLPEGLRVVVRLFDAETGLLLAVKRRDVRPGDDQQAAVAGLVDELHDTLMGHYPLRARLRDATPEGLVIDAGYRAGIRTGQRFATVVTELDAGRVVLDTAHPHVVREVRADESVLDVADESMPLAVGDRLQALEEAAP